MSLERFRSLIGEIISTCGLLESIVNGLINTLGRDPILAGKIVRLPSWSFRIDVFCQLLERAELPPDEVKSLCEHLKRVGRERNDVAHNPIADPDNPHILVLRDVSNMKELHETDLEKQLERTHAALTELKRFLPKIGVPVPKRNPQ